MPRTKSKSSKKHRKVKKAAKGFKQARRVRVKNAKEALLHAGQYAYAGRKLRKRDIRSLWVTRLNAAVREHGISYSVFIKKLKDAKIELDRKMMADIAVNDPDSFKQLVDEVKKSA